MKNKYFNQIKNKNKLTANIVLSLLVVSVGFSIYGLFFGTPVHDQLSGVITKGYAVIYFIVILSLGIGMMLVSNLYISTIILIFFFLLVAFWEVASNAVYGFGYITGVILALLAIYKSKHGDDGDRTK